ncbi:hypothetical protein ACWD5V_28295 [Streptomyces sp. NPDC002523]
MEAALGVVLRGFRSGDGRVEHKAPHLVDHLRQRTEDLLTPARTLAQHAWILEQITDHVFALAPGVEVGEAPVVGQRAGAALGALA